MLDCEVENNLGNKLTLISKNLPEIYFVNRD